jgi:hypothetical protein
MRTSATPSVMVIVTRSFIAPSSNFVRHVARRTLGTASAKAAPV